MKLHRRPSPQRFAQGISAALGNFDGVHLGHKFVIESALHAAKTKNLQAAVISFDPHPARYFKPESAAFNLCTSRQKFLHIKALGIEHYIALPFTKALAQLTAEEFIDRILTQQLNVKHLVVGEGFRFGKQRGGNTDTLKQAAFSCEVIPPVLHNGTRYSSSTVRQALQQGDITHAKAALGRAFTMEGRVVHGTQKATGVLGFPTANILPQQIIPLHGVYAGTAQIEGDTKHYKAVANIGIKPTLFHNHQPVLEVHLHQFTGDLYGKHLCFTFENFIRPEQKFTSLEALRTAIEADIKIAFAL